ncbi:hypothetical protein PG989_010635 [Apiospora arundinis]|uniref:AhpD-like protein n=1 Tax=Apiospora arundinis TaxID=335852 RepID=A0ABR2HPD8_9PEZI
MEPRFPINEAPDSDAKQTMERALTNMHGGAPPFQWIEEDGKSLVGCYAPLCYTPQVAQQFFEVAKTMYQPTAVQPRHRELAILGLASVLDVPYVAYCHRPLCAKLGISDAQYDQGLAGTTPEGLSVDDAMAYRLGRVLTELKAPLGGDMFKEAVEALGKTEVVGIVHTIAGYRWVALLDHVNGEDRRWESM